MQNKDTGILHFPFLNCHFSLLSQRPALQCLLKPANLRPIILAVSPT
jgi:hypothetical protein